MSRLGGATERRSTSSPASSTGPGTSALRPRRPRLRRDAVEQRLHPSTTHLEMRQRHGREAGVERCRDDLEVVDADDRAVTRHLEPDRLCCLVDTHGDLVVVAEDRRGALARRLVEQPSPHAAAACGIGTGALDHRVPVIESSPLDRRPESRVPAAGDRRIAHGRDEREAPMTRGEQVGGGGLREGVLVGCDRRHDPPGRRDRVDEDDRDVTDAVGALDLLMGTAREQDSVDPAVGERARGGVPRAPDLRRSRRPAAARHAHAQPPAPRG